MAAIGDARGAAVVSLCAGCTWSAASSVRVGASESSKVSKASAGRFSSADAGAVFGEGLGLSPTRADSLRVVGFLLRGVRSLHWVRRAAASCSRRMLLQ
eukprot:3876967-Prymnesium_polylepis.1